MRIVRSQISLLLLFSGIVYLLIFCGYLVLSFSGENLISVLIFIQKINQTKQNYRSRFNSMLIITNRLKFQFITIKIKKFILMSQLNDYLFSSHLIASHLIIFIQIFRFDGYIDNFNIDE